jgi:hypothetical protein
LAEGDPWEPFRPVGELLALAWLGWDAFGSGVPVDGFCCAGLFVF